VTATAITQDLFTHERLLLLYTRFPGVFWRHDVDVSLTAAVQMARFAKLAGARCTFCVMARSEFYNPFSAQGERALLEIKENGHKLAAHVDLSEISNPRFAVVRDLRLWDEAYPTLFEDDYIAFHMPPPSVIWKDFETFHHGHESRWEGKYVSDSRREWSEEKEARVQDGMQVALHPEYWFGGRS
jgi:hypothetical protein